MMNDEARTIIRRAIETRAHITTEDGTIVSRRNNDVKKTGWLIDLRAITLDSEVLEGCAQLFWEQFKDIEHIQIGGIETAGIPLVAGFIAHAKHLGHHPHTNGFFIRKSRKKDGLLKMLEGTLEKDSKIVLVDDLVNSGKSLIRQIEVLKERGMDVHAIWTILRFRNPEYYEYFTSRGIHMHSLFTLDDFAESRGLQNLTRIETALAERYTPWKILWKFSATNPSYQHVVPKSEPALDATRVYAGSDAGVFRALNQETGAIEWELAVGPHGKGKGIFSSPAIRDGTVFFGAYDGNVYALDAATGKKKWVYWDADWVGSSPAVSGTLGLVFIGLEFGLWRKHGGIIALNIETGAPVWEFTMPCLTHSSPLYIAEHEQVVIGSNDGAVYLFDARTGTLQWKFSRGELTERELATGFGENDIKESFAYDVSRDLILFGAMDGSCMALERTTGAQRFVFKATFGIYSTPLIFHDTVIFTSLDKHVYCLSLDTFALRWKWQAGARIFASPTIIDGVLFIGANTGRLTELDPETGEALRFFTVSERITNRPAWNPMSKRLFLPTFANEIYCIER